MFFVVRHLHNLVEGCIEVCETRARVASAACVAEESHWSETIRCRIYPVIERLCIAVKIGACARGVRSVVIPPAPWIPERSVPS